MEDFYNKKIQSAPAPEKVSGVDIKDEFIGKIIDGEDAKGLNVLTSISYDRDTVYDKLDDMCSDSIVSAILETYVEDTTCIGQDGRIVYVDSTDAKISKFVNFLLDELQVDKHIGEWATSLIKYGDVYLRLYRQSDMDADLQKCNVLTESASKPLSEDLVVDYHNRGVDKYALYVEQVLNPAEMFELKKYGKTVAYIRCPISSLAENRFDSMGNRVHPYNYVVRKSNQDTKVFQATEFVHGSLPQSVSRVAETIQVFDSDEETDDAQTYTVNRGQSLFYNAYTSWKQMTMLENVMLLNRINTMSILRLFNVEIGNVVSDADAQAIVSNVYQMLQTKLSINKDNMSKLYLSDQPTVSYAVMPTKNGAGAITATEIGGKSDGVDMDDINYFRDKFFGAMRAIKQYFGQTSGDSAGFDAGGNLAQLSMRYGKAIRLVQNALVQMITDMINLYCYDRKVSGYINKFSIKMHFPLTQEDTAKQSYKKDEIELVLRIMEGLDTVADDMAKLKILKYLLATVIDDGDVLATVQEEIEKQVQKDKDGDEDEEGDSKIDLPDGDSGSFDSGMNDNTPTGLGGGGLDVDLSEPVETAEEAPEAPTEPTEEPEEI